MRLVRILPVVVALFAISGMMFPTTAFAGTGDDENDFNAVMMQYSFKSARLVNFGPDDVPLYFKQIIYSKENIAQGPDDVLCGGESNVITYIQSSGIEESQKTTVSTKIVYVKCKDF